MAALASDSFDLPEGVVVQDTQDGLVHVEGRENGIAVQNGAVAVGDVGPCVKLQVPGTGALVFVEGDFAVPVALNVHVLVALRPDVGKTAPLVFQEVVPVADCQEVEHADAPRSLCIDYVGKTSH